MRIGIRGGGRDGRGEGGGWYSVLERCVLVCGVGGGMGVGGGEGSRGREVRAGKEGGTGGRGVTQCV